MDIYCVYVTVYRGNKLPPFYIGSTSIKKIEDGYKGSVSSEEYKRAWKSELSDSPHLFKTKIIKTFDTRSEAFDYEEFLQVKLDVVRSPMYVNRSLAKKKFTTTGWKFTKEHKKKISESEKGKYVSEETRKKQSLSHKGQMPWMHGKSHNDRTKDKIRESVKKIDYGTKTCEYCGRIGKAPSIHLHIKTCKTKPMIISLSCLEH